MADFSGGLTTPFLAAFDPDGSKTDQLMGRGRGGPDDEHPGFQNGACLNHPEGCGITEGGSRPGSGTQPNYIGGDPSQGRYAMASDPGAPPEPPKSPSGHNWYTDEELAAWDAAGRPPNHDYLRGG